jgi:1-acyl-sn-glycerol-3-phosphate acyltransferase
VVTLMRLVAGIRLEVRGRENIPGGAAAPRGSIVASKHQSAFDTLVYHLLLDDPAVVLKKELLSIPVYGWYCRKTAMIAVDRKGGAAALKRMMAAARAAVARGRPILIFPEGTRTAPGVETSYQPGVAGLYKGLAVPVVPVALNSGLFWPRRSLRMCPGALVVEFLEPIPPGLPRGEFMERLHGSIESAARRLEAEAQSRSSAET